jgi:hypothetical protein
MLRERYIWSVFPSLAAWPILQMETAPGSLLASLLLVSERLGSMLGRWKGLQAGALGCCTQGMHG